MQFQPEDEDRSNVIDLRGAGLSDTEIRESYSPSLPPELVWARMSALPGYVGTMGAIAWDSLVRGSFLLSYPDQDLTGRGTITIHRAPQDGMPGSVVIDAPIPGVPFDTGNAADPIRAALRTILDVPAVQLTQASYPGLSAAVLQSAVSAAMGAAGIPVTWATGTLGSLAALYGYEVVLIDPDQAQILLYADSDGTDQARGAIEQLFAPILAAAVGPPSVDMAVAGQDGQLLSGTAAADSAAADSAAAQPDAGSP